MNSLKPGSREQAGRALLRGPLVSGACSGLPRAADGVLHSAVADRIRNPRLCLRAGEEVVLRGSSRKSGM